MLVGAAKTIVPGRPKIRAKAVALPVEHGSWGFLFEPLVAGVCLAPSLAAPWISLVVIGAFLMRQPLKVILSGGIAGRHLPQTALALKFAFAYAAVFAAGLAGCILTAPRNAFVPFAIVMPFAAYQIYCDATRSSRLLAAELIGAVAISSSIAVIALAAGWSYPSSAALWAIIAARLIPSILYVRNRLKLEKGKVFSRFVPIAAHLLAAAMVLTLAVNGLSSYLVVLMFAALFVRCAIGLSPYRKKVKAMKIGIGEVVYGTLTVLSLIVGSYLGY